MTDTAAAPPAAPTHGGPRDFDPYFGRWHLHTRKLRDVLDPECTEWVEFAGTNEVTPILGGLGNIELSSNDFETPFEGMSLRLYDPESGLWRIWWASTRQPGQMGPPTEGRFENGTGLFLCDEVLAGRETKVRFQWTGIAEGEPRWEQAFSYDGGESWRVNWVTTSRR